jgi:hypothetical protein
MLASAGGRRWVDAVGKRRNRSTVFTVDGDARSIGSGQGTIPDGADFVH